jgi:acyl-CoA thioester hydrolase
MKNWPNSASSANSPVRTQGEKPFILVDERVRYSETDQMGVAHNKNYFEWFEIGRTEFIRQRKIPYKEIEKLGYYLVVVEAFCRYKRPLRYDDCFLIRVALDELTPKKAVFSYLLLTKDEQKSIASGYTVHIVTDAKGKVTVLPEEILGKIKAVY